MQCKAKSKRSGTQCRNNAVKERSVCRMHGGCSRGAKTNEGLRRMKESKITHGKFTKESVAEKKAFRSMINEFKKCL